MEIIFAKIESRRGMYNKLFAGIFAAGLTFGAQAITASDTSGVVVDGVGYGVATCRKPVATVVVGCSNPPPFSPEFAAFAFRREK